MSESHSSALAHQFDDLEQQDSASTLCMWAFLGTEVMFFGGLFLAYILFRSFYPDAFAAGSQHLDIPLGSINTGVLLCSSLAMALAVNAAHEGKGRNQVIFIILTMVLGTAFLGVKGYEWYHDYEQGLAPGVNWTYTGAEAKKVELFFVMYFTMTGVHGLHMIIGIGVLAVFLVIAWREPFNRENAVSVETMGLYWHFVDIVWVFLFPLFYLIDVHK